ncbi:imidazole glycerol phosphate synthase subunit HisH [Nanchangia anserum]|uniref:Imidazole glycerol phosphate synthase subunit HisH n=1 Tax=Nanchangia anserum TaxID=2692125 RepID=A0A8I0GE08_9ACTO|nr:imidazole glycerol phosphate synthase subunit HisH [Nanchangia anserum]MBD3690221.1 imidazole glycerol phosphate synthase subunit HisH [Nanchangia anserum]QOX82334.1 imidazole glycerol phosphate synthase subunit HisH [Nanchangia anserum]
MSPQVVVLDYGSGNVRSACRALEKAGARVRLSDDRDAARHADGLVVPGVGAFDAVARALRETQADDLIRERIAADAAVFGICVGMQVLFSQGLEGGAASDGLGVFSGDVSALHAPIVPHMGWSPIEAGEGTRVFRGVEGELFYFVHSYAAHAVPASHPDAVVTWAEHGERFVAAIECGAVSATQFHPEKSGEAGRVVLANWLDTL